MSSNGAGWFGANLPVHVQSPSSRPACGSRLLARLRRSPSCEQRRRRRRRPAASAASSLAERSPPHPKSQTRARVATREEQGQHPFPRAPSSPILCMGDGGSGGQFEE